MGVIHIILLVLLFFTELSKYWIGISAFTEIKLKRKWVSIVCSIVYILLLKTTSLDDTATHLIMYAIAGVVIIINIQEKWWLKIKVFLGSFMLIATLDEILGILIGSFFQGYVGNVPTGTLNLLLSNLVIICLICILAFLKNKTVFLGANGFRSFAKKNISVVIIVLSVYLLFTVMGLNYAKEYVNKERYTTFSNTVGVTSLVCIFIIGWFMLYIRSINERLEEKIYSEQMLREMQLEQYKKMLEKEADTRKYRHDMNNQLICLEELMKQNKQEEAKNYIIEMQNDLHSINKKMYTVGNEILDAILNYHLSGLGKEVKIEIHGMCNRELRISNVDLCTIFANPIQNATEELKKEYSGDRYLIIKVKTGLEILQIEITNSLSDESLYKANLLESKKRDLKNHGLGLENVKRAVEKNDGQMIIKISDNEFQSIITLGI